jgi:hypothetical protein
MRIEITKDTFSSQLNLSIGRAGDFSEPIGIILNDGLAAAQEQIVEGKGALFGGEPWFPMAESTVKKGRDPATLLIDRGVLLLSLNRGGPGNFFDVGPMEGAAGTAITDRGYPYAIGQTIGARNRPPRPFLWWPEERIPQYESLFLDHMTGEGGNA